MSGLFLLSISSPYLYSKIKEYINEYNYRSPLLSDFENNIIYPITELSDENDENRNENNENENNESNKIKRNDSEFSLGLSRSKSFNDIGQTNFNSLGICTTGKITYEIIKYFGSAIIIMGIFWQITEITKVNYKK